MAAIKIFSVPVTPMTSWVAESYRDDGKLNSFPIESEMAIKRQYSANLPLKLSTHDCTPGSNLPGALRGALSRRNCFVVHSD